MRRVVLESPFAGQVERNVAYARRALKDCLRRGEAPIASHLLFTQPGVLDDGDPEQRALGIAAGLAWGPAADATVVYTDHGISRGMRYGIERAEREGRPVEFREIGAEREPALTGGRLFGAELRAAMSIAEWVAMVCAPWCCVSCFRVSWGTEWRPLEVETEHQRSVLAGAP